MTQDTRQLIIDSARRSAAGELHFGPYTALLAGAGVESYHVDYRAGRTTFYLPDGATCTVDTSTPETPVPARFDAGALRAAIRGAQQGAVMYPAFKRLSQAAGCASYDVWITGRHVVYHGRQGETHVEPFPD